MKSPYFIFAALMLSVLSVHAFDLGNLKGKLGDLSKQPSAQNRAQPASTNPAALDNFSNPDQIGSLKQALTQGAESAVKNLAQQNGYLGNDKVRIPLPDSLKKADGLLRKVGMSKYADELVASMNHAAEAAVPEAQTLLVGAVQKMTVQDAKSILTGGDDAATQYFRKNTETALAGKFKPIVNKSMQKVQLAQKYDQFANKGAQFGLVEERDAKLDDYITRKALDGLFVMMAEQEKAIRANPMQATGALAKKIFSAIKF